MAHSVLKVLATIGASVAVAVHAQSLPTPADMPAYDAGSVESGEGLEAVPAQPHRGEPITYDPLQPIAADALSLTGCGPAITESSGTWLRRGLWYADIDAVVMARTWDSDGITFMEEYDSVGTQVIANIGSIPFTDTQVVQQDRIGESSPGYGASARLSLGRFLFRDQSNRDHTAEMVVMGGQEWNENLALDQQLFGADGLNLPIAGPRLGIHTSLDGSGPTDLDISAARTGFDQASSMELEYASRFHNWEWNYNVTERMRKDRMELQPSGEWVRRASPGMTWSYLAGLRYFDVEERLNWFATDIASIGADVDGAYNIKTSNNLFGLQLGGGLTYETDRWNVTISTKQGVYVNDARATTDLAFTSETNGPAVALNDYTTDLHVNTVSYIGTGSILARYHLRPNISLRAGWEFMYVNGLALAPNQADFNPTAAQLRTSSDAFYHGITFGSEFYW